MILSSCHFLSDICIEHFFNKGGLALVFFKGEIISQGMEKAFINFYWQLFNRNVEISKALKGIFKKMISENNHFSQILLYGNAKIEMKKYLYINIYIYAIKN